MNYNNFPSLIKSRSELTLGLVVFHVYGHLEGYEPTAEKIIREPYQEDQTWCFDAHGNSRYCQQRCCGDVGLDGANHNHNRLFRDESDALAFIEACRKAGIRRPFRDHHDDLDY